MSCGACRPTPPDNPPDEQESTPESAGSPSPTQSGLSTPDAIQPDAIQPDAIQPDAIQPDALTAWANTWKENSGSPEQREQLLMRGKKIAAQRREHMLALIVSDPARALASELPDAARRLLPKEIADVIEHPVSGRAQYDLLIVCGTHGESGAHGEACRKEAQIATLTTRYTAHHVGDAWRAYIGVEGPVRGLAVDDQIAVAPPPPPAPL